MESWTSYRLARRAEGTGPRARWARRRLLRAGGLGDTRVIDDVWDLWLRSPRDELLTALVWWGRPRTGDGLSLLALGRPAPVADVVEAARRAGHPIADRARARILAGDQALVDAVCEAATADEVLAGFCAAHQLAPADPHRAAVYFLLTGQHEAYLLSDPDHSLLAVVYQGAGEDERARVRAAAAGHPELVRVLAETVGRGRMARLSPHEAEYLADAFAERQDWPGLWELARNLPLLDAAGAVRRCGDWRPEGPDAALFDALAAADPAELAGAHAALLTPWTVSAPGTVSGGSVAPDGRRVVVTTTSTVDVFAVPPGAQPVHQERVRTRHNSEVLALDGGVLVVGDWSQAAHGFSPLGYLQSSTDQPGVVRFQKAFAFARTGDGFAALTRGEGRRPQMCLLSGSGKDFSRYERRVVDLCVELGVPAKYADRQWTMATDPGTGLIAFAGHGVHLARLTGEGVRPLASAPFATGLNPYIGFAGPDRLVVLGDHKVLRVWRRDGDELGVVAERKISGTTAAVVPGAGVVATIEHPDNTRRRLRHLDGETLADLPVPSRFGQREDPTALVTAPDGNLLVVGHHGHAELLDVGLAALAERPLAATTPADLDGLRARMAGEWTGPAAKPFLELLQTCLVHRFGVDVAIGRATPLKARDDDIALGGAS